MSKTNGNVFLKALASSKILDDEKMAVATKLGQSNSDPKVIAVELIRAQLLTSWQAKFLLTGRSKLNLGNYVLLERLNRGALGDRFKARHVQLDKVVEVQLMEEGFSKRPELIDLFLKNAQHAAELDHPHLIHVFDVGQEATRYFLVSEFFNGRQLDDREFVSSMDLSSLGNGLAAIGQAIKYSHEQGVVCGCLDSSKIVIDESGVFKLENTAISGIIDQFENTRDGNLAVRQVPVDDWNAFGAIGVSLTDLENLGLNDGQRRLLGSIFSQFVSLRENDTNKASILLKTLDKFVAENSPGHAMLKDVSSGIGDSQDFVETNVEPLLADQAGVNPNRVSDNLNGGTLSNDKVEMHHDDVQPGRDGLVRSLVVAGLAMLATFLLVGIGAGLYFTLFSMQDAEERNRVSKSYPKGSLAKIQASQKVKKNELNNLKKRSSAEDVAIPGENFKKERVKAQSDNSPNTVLNTNQETESGLNESKNPLELVSSSDIGKVSEEIADNVSDKIQKSNDSTSPKKNENDGKTLDKTVLPDAFSEFDEFQELPLSSNLEKMVLGKVFCGKNHLLGLQLITDSEVVASRSVEFKATRGEGSENQRWKFSVERRTKSTVIAEIWREKDQLFFQWAQAAEKNQQAGYLRNCLLRLEAREDVIFAKLRKAAEIGDLSVAEGKMTGKSKISLADLPNPTAIKYELLRPKDSLIEKHTKLFFTPETRRIEGQSLPIFIFTTKLDSAKIYWMRLDVKIGESMQFQTRLQCASDLGVAKGKTLTKKGLRQLYDKASAISRQFYIQRETLAAYEPKDGEKRKHARELKAANERVEEANKANTEIQRIIPLVEKLYGFPIQLRVFYEIDGHEVDLATYDGNPTKFK